MAIEITREPEELRAQAEGAKPFVPNALFERLTEKAGTKDYWGMTPQQRLCLGYYLAARRRHNEVRSEER